MFKEIIFHNRCFYNSIERDYIRDEYINNKESLRVLAKKFNVSHETIRVYVGNAIRKIGRPSKGINDKV